MTLAQQRLAADIYARVAEMVDPAVEDLLALPVATLEEIRRDDPSPQFVVMRVEEGKSHNNRIWTPTILEKVAEQVNSTGGTMPGYKGHIPDEHYGHVFPPTQTRWMKAATRTENGKKVVYFKGYNLPGREIRDEVKHGLARTVSWIGNAALRAVKGGYEVVDFVCDSIDWSRPGAEGMNARLVTVAAEMKEGGKVEAADIAQITERDLESSNPNLVRVMEMRGERKVEERVREMEQKVEAAKVDTDIVEKLLKALGLEKKDDILDNVATLHKSVTDIAKERTKQAISTALAKIFPNEDQRALVSQFALVQEMRVEGDTAETRAANAEKEIREALNTNEAIRKLVGEMQSSENGLNLNGSGEGERGGSGGNSSGFKVGSETAHVTHSRVSL